MIYTSGPSEQIALHTIQPTEMPASYVYGTYRTIVGVGHQGRSLWLPNVRIEEARQESFRVPADMADNIARYFEKYYLREPDAYRNCHIGAAAMTGVGELDWVDALAHANSIMMRGGIISGDKLPVGAQGIIGEIYDVDEPVAYHSLVGIAPGLGVQTDRENGPFSLVSHDDNLNRYQAAEDTARSQLYGRL